MQKIMFEHRRFGLEQAVIAGTKTMTRRRIHFPGIDDEDVSKPVLGAFDEKGRVYFTFDARTEDVDVYPKYQIGEQVAVAQCYKTIYDTMEEQLGNSKANEWWCSLYSKLSDNVEPIMAKGYNNKLFVRADLMPHVIEITDIKAERLQDISDEDCLREGIQTWLGKYIVPNIMERELPKDCFDTPREAFAALIDRISGRGTWERNEWQFVYTFKLIK